MSLAASLVLVGCASTPGEASPDNDAGSSATDARPAAVEASADSGADASGNALTDAPSTGALDGQTVFACQGNVPPGDMVSVPAGTFTMGCGAADTQCRDDEKPAHAVTLSAFQIDRTEVTQGQYTACVQAKKCSAPSCAWDCNSTTYPAGCLEWAQAKAFCAWAGKRLPTEAEWEMAARGTDGRLYPWGNDAPDCAHANMAGCLGHTDAVGARPAGNSPYGAEDMEGNMVEMVADWYDATFYTAAPVTEPTGPATGTRYVGRGGGYKSTAVWQRASSRDWYDLTDTGQPLGFRCAR